MSDTGYPPNVDELLKMGGEHRHAEATTIPPMTNILDLLPFIETGWTYKTDAGGRICWLVDKRIPASEAETITLLKGQGRYAPKLSYPDPKTNPQWLLGVYTWFSNPNGVMLLKMGSHQYSVSPLSLQTFAYPGLNSRLTASLSVVNHLSAYGPQYGLSVDPPMPLPIPPEDFRLEYYLCPDTSITDDLEIVSYVVSRIIITDVREFLNAYQRVSAEFIVGGRMGRWISPWRHR